MLLAHNRDMTTSSAKDLLAQADQLMRGGKAHGELPVLTELIDERARKMAIEDIPSLTDRIDFDPIDTRPSAANPNPGTRGGERGAASKAAISARIDPVLGDDADEDVDDEYPTGPRATPSRSSDAERAAAYTREQFDKAVATKLEELGHAVYSQVMQQLELHAAGELKRRLREALEPALMQVSLDIAAQVADETSNQIQSVVTVAVEAEVARLREQIQAKRRDAR